MAGMPFTPQLDAMLELAVAENRREPDAHNPAGIMWVRINAKVINGDYGAELRARVGSSSSKVLPKRWRHLHQ